MAGSSARSAHIASGFLPPFAAGCLPLPSPSNPPHPIDPAQSTRPNRPAPIDPAQNPTYHEGPSPAATTAGFRSGGCQSGQMERIANPLRKLRGFESHSALCFDSGRSSRRGPPNAAAACILGAPPPGPFSPDAQTPATRTAAPPPRSPASRPGAPAPRRAHAAPPSSRPTPPAPAPAA